MGWSVSICIQRHGIRYKNNNTHLTSSTRCHLSHHLLPADTLLSTLLEFTHIFPVTLALLLLGIDAASIKRRGGCGEGGLSDGGDDERLFELVGMRGESEKMEMMSEKK